jgi:hypothetical protein
MGSPMDIRVFNHMYSDLNPAESMIATMNMGSFPYLPSFAYGICCRQ